MEVKFEPPSMTTLAAMACILMADEVATVPLTVAVAMPTEVALALAGGVDVAELELRVN